MEGIVSLGSDAAMSALIAELVTPTLHFLGLLFPRNSACAESLVAGLSSTSALGSLNMESEVEFSAWPLTGLAGTFMITSN